MDFDESTRQGAPAGRGREPLFYVGIQLYDRNEIPNYAIQQIPCDEFRLPPGGTSKEEDFDMLCHLEVEPEKEEKKKGEEDDEDEQEDIMAEPEQKYKLVVPTI